MKSHTKLSLTKLLLTITLALAVALAIACSNDSVVPDKAATNPANAANANASATPADVAAQSSPPATASPIVSPTPVSPTPIGPVRQTTQGSPFEQQPGETKQMAGNMPVMVSPAKPALTPAPDPFPPRAAPRVVMENGKIKQQWQVPVEAANLTSPVKGRPDAARLGQEYYLQKCADCHGRAGKGNGWMSAMTKRDGKPLPPTNLASKAVQANSDGELFWKITNGKSPMPAHRVRFDDDQRWLIVAYLRTLKP